MGPLVSLNNLSCKCYDLKSELSKRWALKVQPKVNTGLNRSIPTEQTRNPSESSFNFARTVIMLQYLQGHTMPDITLAVSHAVGIYTSVQT